MQGKVVQTALGRFIKFFSGTVVYAASQLVATILVAHMEGAEILAIYLLAIAFSTPVALFFNYSLRQLVIADVDRRFSEKSFRVARWILLICALGFSYGLTRLFPGYFLGWEHIMLLVLVAKVQDGAVELAIGLMQRDEKFNSIAKVLYLKAVLLLAVCGVGLAFQGIYLFLVLLIVSNSILGFWASSLTKTRIVDKNVGAFTILRAGLPLASAAFLISLAVNLPRVGVELIVDRNSFAIFAAALQLSLPAQLLVSTASQYLMPRLVRACAANDVDAFRFNAKRLLATATGIGLVFSVMYWTIMPWVLSLLYDLQLDKTSLGIMNGVAFMVFALSILNATNFLLIATKAYVEQLKITAISVLAMACIIWGWVEFPLFSAVWLVVILSLVNIFQAVSGLVVANQRASAFGGRNE